MNAQREYVNISHLALFFDCLSLLPALPSSLSTPKPTPVGRARHQGEQCRWKWRQKMAVTPLRLLHALRVRWHELEQVCRIRSSMHEFMHTYMTYTNIHDRVCLSLVTTIRSGEHFYSLELFIYSFSSSDTGAEISASR